MLGSVLATRTFVGIGVGDAHIPATGIARAIGTVDRQQSAFVVRIAADALSHRVNGGLLRRRDGQCNASHVRGREHLSPRAPAGGVGIAPDGEIGGAKLWAARSIQIILAGVGAQRQILASIEGLSGIEIHEFPGRARVGAGVDSKAGSGVNPARIQGAHHQLVRINNGRCRRKLLPSLPSVAGLENSLARPTLVGLAGTRIKRVGIVRIHDQRSDVQNRKDVGEGGPAMSSVDRLEHAACDRSCIHGIGVVGIDHQASGPSAKIPRADLGPGFAADLAGCCLRGRDRAAGHRKRRHPGDVIACGEVAVHRKLSHFRGETFAQEVFSSSLGIFLFGLFVFTRVGVFIGVRDGGRRRRQRERLMHAGASSEGNENRGKKEPFHKVNAVKIPQNR